MVVFSFSNSIEADCSETEAFQLFIFGFLKKD
jgi:hypothetical protein